MTQLDAWLARARGVQKRARLLESECNDAAPCEHAPIIDLTALDDDNSVDVTAVTAPSAVRRENDCRWLRMDSLRHEPWTLASAQQAAAEARMKQLMCELQAAKNEADVLRLRNKEAEALPAHWVQMHSNAAECVLVTVEPDTSEYVDVMCALANPVLIGAVVKVERVQNARLWKQYVAMRRLIALETRAHASASSAASTASAAAPSPPLLSFEDGCKAARASLHARENACAARVSVDHEDARAANETWLLHGTRKTPPMVVCSSTGIDPRYGEPGFFGRASYFTTDIAYIAEHAYLHVAGSNSGQVILAQVATGLTKEEVCPMVRHELYKHPPPPYHSVHGLVTEAADGKQATAATATYMVGQSYPAYIISCHISERKPAAGAAAP